MIASRGLRCLNPKGIIRKQIRCLASKKRIVLRKPDDLHLHVRDGEILKAVVPFSSKLFARSTIMPNTIPPITTVAMAEEYKHRILNSVTHEDNFHPLMTLYLTDITSQKDVEAVANSQHVLAFKLYPAGATTNSENGVTDIWKLLPIFREMAKMNVLLLVHGEVTDPSIDVFDREKEFLKQVLIPLLDKVPDLRVVMEHITTQDAAEYVQLASDNIAATITPQHIILNRNDLFKGGLRPHHYCLPVLKRENHRQAVLKAAVSGNKRFFLGTDSAPHPRNSKESSCGCAGIFNAPVALSIYAEAFEKEGALDKLESFTSLNGAEFYGLEPSEEQIELVREQWTVPKQYIYEEFSLVPFMAGENLAWRVSDCGFHNKTYSSSEK